MKKIEVETQQVRRESSNILNSLNTISNRIKTTYDAMRVLDSMWDGPANSAFNEQFAADAQRLSEICQDLTSFANDVNKAAQVYESGESSVHDIVSSLPI